MALFWPKTAQKWSFFDLFAYRKLDQKKLFAYIPGLIVLKSSPGVGTSDPQKHFFPLFRRLEFFGKKVSKNGHFWAVFGKNKAIFGQK